MGAVSYLDSSGISYSWIPFVPFIKEKIMGKEEFVSHGQAVALKELGFDEMCFGFYNSISFISSKCKNSEPWMGNEVVAVPLKSQVFRWFDENTSYQGFVTHSIKEEHFDWYIINYDDVSQGIECIEYYSSRQEAESACIDKLLELAKQ